jgi:predicted HicB family RNase H-like nuclease
MAKTYKQIRVKIPAEVHKKIKLSAVQSGKTLAERIVDILTARVERE